MSHLTCPKCGSNEHYQGYGLAAGPLGSYTVCECGEILENKSDPAGERQEEKPE
jgi:hypothetical protein